MKEIIVIPREKIKVLTSCGHFPANGYFTFEKEDAEVEQVPETFEELKELLKSYSGKINKDVSGYAVGKKAITIVLDGMNLHFDKDGIFAYYKRYKRTPQQMWQIIKNLIGEEE